MAVKQRVSVTLHGENFLVGVDTFFASHPGSTDTTISEVLHAPTDEALGSTVLRLLDRSGVLDLGLVARGEPGRSYAAASLGLPSDAVLQSEAVEVGVDRRGGRLMVDPLQSEGVGGGFGGNLEEEVLEEQSSAEVVGAAVRAAAGRAVEASAAVMRPAGSWRGHPTATLPSTGVVTVRRDADGWSVTARINAPGDGLVGEASSSVARVARDAELIDLGRAVLDTLALAGGGGLQPGEESGDGGERQVLVEAGDLGLTLYPQLVSPDTGVWDAPAHVDLRTVGRKSSIRDVGQAIALTADEVPAW